MRINWKGKNIVHQLLIMFFMMAILSFFIFSLSRLAPVDPLKSYYGESSEHMSIEEQQQAREALGLNDSIFVQYGHWASGVLKGDWGTSYTYKRPVKEVFKDVGVNTFLLGSVSYILTFLLALFLGIFCAKREGRWLDKIICKLGVVSSSLPVFFIALALLYFFSVKFHWFPTGSAYDVGQEYSLLNRIHHMVLPVSVLVIEHLWYYGYMVRNKMIEEFDKNYILMGKVKGLSENKIIFGHCLPNILPGFLMMMALALPHILGGTYVVEMVFSYPGIGLIGLESIKYGDYNMLLFLCLITGALVFSVHFIVGIINATINPLLKEKEVMAGE